MRSGCFSSRNLTFEDQKRRSALASSLKELQRKEALRNTNNKAKVILTLAQALDRMLFLFRYDHASNYFG